MTHDTPGRGNFAWSRVVCEYKPAKICGLWNRNSSILFRQPHAAFHSAAPILEAAFSGGRCFLQGFRYRISELTLSIKKMRYYMISPGVYYLLGPIARPTSYTFPACFICFPACIGVSSGRTMCSRLVTLYRIYLIDGLFDGLWIVTSNVSM